MTLFYEEEGEFQLPFECMEFAERVAFGALDYLKCPYEAQVNLLLTENEEIHALNFEFREIDRATDVLSFPMAEYDVPGNFECLETQDDCFDPETGELILGDIVISKEKVMSQAEEYGHSPEREFAFLITHSILHLSGYDHIEEDERIQMEELQREILNELKILR